MATPHSARPASRRLGEPDKSAKQWRRVARWASWWVCHYQFIGALGYGEIKLTENGKRRMERNR